MTANNKSYWIKSGLLTFMERFSVQLFGFGSFWCLVRTLSIADFGIWVIFSAVFSILEVARAGLIQNALVKFLSTAEDDATYAKINTASLFLNVIITIFMVSVLWGLSSFIGKEYESAALTTMLQIYIFTTVLLAPFHQFNFIQQANLSFKGIFASNFTKQGLFFAFVVFFFTTNQALSIIQLTYFQAITAIAASGVSFFYARQYLRFSWQIDFSWVKKLLQFGMFVFGTNLSTMLHKRIDTLMLGSFMAPLYAAFYETCIKVTNLVEIPTFSIASIVFPQSARQSASEGTGAAKQLYEKSVGAILAITFPAIIFVLLFPEFIIWVIAGQEEYLAAVPLLRLTILYALFIPFGNQFGTILDSIGKPHINFIFVVLGAIINVISNYVFIKQFGFVGAAYGTLLTYIIMFITNQIVLYKMLDVKAWNAFYYIISFYKEAFALVKKKLLGRKNDRQLSVK